jgi:mannose-1-phosphate guanylyltransferase
VYVVILAGGGGTRLRPLSTDRRPKPFLPLLGEESLLQATVARILGPDLGVGPDDVTVVVADAYAALVREQVPDVGLLVEPAGRNTAPAIALAAVAIERPPDEVMVVLPADHAIGDAARFRDVLAAAADLAGGAFGIDAPLVTLGVAPTRPATEFGYLRPRPAPAAAPGTVPAAPLATFEEKPSPARAAELVAEPGVAWNAGMFVWRREAILDALRAHAPILLGLVETGVAAGRLEHAYAGFAPEERRSVDYAVMEPAAVAGRVVMAAMDAGWSDIGTRPALLEAIGAPGIEGGVVEGGVEVPVAPDDLLVERVAGRCVAVAGADGTRTANAPVAHLRAARPHWPIVDALIERCTGWEARS